MMNKDRQTFLSLASKSIADRVARHRAFDAAKSAKAAQSVRESLIASGVIKPATLTGMDRAKELCQLALNASEVK